MPEASRRLFRPIIAGATLRERLLACAGALVGIGLTTLVSATLLGVDSLLPAIVAPMGASAVLVFAVPASPLAQPWPVIGGNAISALVGVAVAQAVPDTALAAAIAVSLAILVMSLTRTLHPPGGASALTAVIGGEAIANLGYSFALLPVALNSVLLVAAGIAFHRLNRRPYPHRPAPTATNTHGTADPPAQLRVGIDRTDIDAALAAAGTSFDIDPQDLDRLLRKAESHALVRMRGDISCADIMSRDVVHVGADTGIAEARALLLDHNIRTLPVIDEHSRLVGVVGLRELWGPEEFVGQVMRPAATAAPGDPAIGLQGALTDGARHAVIIVDEDEHVLGIVTQTDLLASTFARLSAARAG